MAHVRLSNLTLGDIGDALIDDPDKHLTHLQGWPIVYVFEGGWSGEKELTFGRVSMKSHLVAVALQGKLKEGAMVACDNSEKCFLVEVNEDLWNLMKDEPDVDLMREQQMYHLLCACVVDENGNPKTVKPNMQLHTEEIAVYGESHRSIQMMLTRLKARRTREDGSELPFRDIFLDETQKKRAQWISDKVTNPKKGYFDGIAPGLLEVEGELLLPVRWGTARILDPKKDQPFFHAVLVSEETEEEKAGPAPLLPFDKRFLSEGMRFKWSLTTDNEEEKDRNRFPTMRVREVGYRLLLPEVQVEQITFPADESGTTVTLRVKNGKTGENQPQPEDSPIELETCPLKVSARLFDNVIDGQAGMVFPFGGSHYMQVAPSALTGRLPEAMRVQPEDVWRKANPNLEPGPTDWEALEMGMLVTDTENEPWVIMANTRYQVQDITAEAGALEAAA